MNCISLRKKICARGHANEWSQMKPSGVDAAGFEPEGGGGSQFDMINHIQQAGGQNQFEVKDHGSPQFIALAS